MARGGKRKTVAIGFRTTEVMRLTGLTRKQLAYWDKKALFKPSILPAKGRGSSRVYSFLDVVQLRVLKKLIDSGVSGRQHLGRWLRHLREHISETALASGTFIVVGKTPLMVCKPAEPTVAIDLARGGQLVWLIGLDAVANEVRRGTKTEQRRSSKPGDAGSTKKTKVQGGLPIDEQKQVASRRSGSASPRGAMGLHRRPK